MVVTNLHVIIQLKKRRKMEMEVLKQISSKLGALRNVIETMNMGFVAEGVEEQVIDCMEGLEVYVNSLKEMVDQHIKENE